LQADWQKCPSPCYLPYIYDILFIMATESTITKKQKAKDCYTRREISNFSKIFYYTVLAHNVHALSKDSLMLAAGVRHVYYSINPPSMKQESIEEWLTSNVLEVSLVKDGIPKLIRKSLNFSKKYNLAIYNKCVDYVNNSDDFSWHTISKVFANPVDTIYQKDLYLRADKGFSESDIKHSGSHLSWLIVKRAMYEIDASPDYNFHNELKVFALGWLTFLKPIALTSRERKMQNNALESTVDMLHKISF